MNYDTAIADMALGEEVEGFYILTEASVRTSSSGKPFLSARLTDASGSVDMKVWDYNGSLAADDNGKVVKIRGEVKDFKGALQLDVRRFRFADPETDSYDLSRLVPTAPIDVDATYEEVKGMIAGIGDDDYRLICEEMLKRHGDSFKKIPAAKSFHHGFVSGLLMHTSDMMVLADFLASRYYEVIDRDLLVAGTFLHDIGKQREFDFTPLGLVSDYSVEGKLLGHLVIGAQEVAEIAKENNIPEEKSVLLQHLLLSHHGQPEWGACVLPQCAEAELLSFIDMIDSRMEIYAEVLQDVPKGQFSQLVRPLEKRLYNHV